ncbi:MAG: hypothetical protein JO151_13540 [Verrucomicrobia bacterium]|nr:hypothetical protein [Verrucomicrobiota bacterium]
MSKEEIEALKGLLERVEKEVEDPHAQTEMLLLVVGMVSRLEWKLGPGGGEGSESD